MKKLLSVALFNIAIMSNASEKKEIVINDFTEIIANTTDEKEIAAKNSKEIKTENCECEKEISEDGMFFGCGSQGNDRYNEWRRQGYSHREARSFRRQWVRDCRGHPNGWVAFVISFGFY